jgi:hypothetical protein
MYKVFANFIVVVFGGLLFIVLAIEPNVCGFKPSQGRWIFQGGEVKYSAPCRKILRHIKKLQCMKEIFRLQNSPPFLAKFVLIFY